MGACVHSAGTARAARARRAHDRKKLGGFCYNWQYSCLYKPYYTPTTLDNLMFHPTPSIRDATVPSHSKDTCKKRQEQSLPLTRSVNAVLPFA